MNSLSKKYSDVTDSLKTSNSRVLDIKPHRIISREDLSIMIKSHQNRLKKLSKRSRLQLFIDVLRAIEKGESKPTRIMYKSNLSWLPFRQILNRMVELRLVKKKKEGTRQLFLMSERGKDFLKNLDNLKRVLTSSPTFSDTIDSIICTFNEEDH